MLIRQNSGLGNSLNVLFPSFTILDFCPGVRGRTHEEKVTANSMGESAENILSIRVAETCVTEDPACADDIVRLAVEAYKRME